jgi:phosphoglycerate dehydrogenase-like enzyme
MLRLGEAVKLALPRRFEDVLRPLPGDVEAAWYEGTDSGRTAAAGADVLWVDTWRRDEVEALLDAGPTIRWLFSHSAGVESFPLDVIRERGLTLTNGAGLHAVPIAEYVVMGMLAAAKNLPAMVRAQERKEWLADPPGFGELSETRALIVGYGQIGRAIGERLTGFGVDVVGARRRNTGEPGVIAGEAWRERLPDFDWVILCAPLTTGTRHLVGRPELLRMKPSAWLVNIARGALVDEPALVEALRERRLAGAYLDVTDPEPPARESPLWSLPNVILTPHSSWASARFRTRAAELFLDNLERYRSGRDLRNVVDLAAGY